MYNIVIHAGGGGGGGGGGGSQQEFWLGGGSKSAIQTARARMLPLTTPFGKPP